MIAVVLVGGEGTRLRPLTYDRPKAMLPIAGRPFLAHLLDRLVAGGVERVIFSCGYLPDPIVAGFGDGYGGMALEYAIEPEPLDTAGAIAFAARGRVGAGPFLALNGDVLASSSLAELMAIHRQRGARATLTLTAVADPSRYGLVLSDDDGAVTAFLEKTAQDGAPGGPGPFWINAGQYALDASVLDLIAPDRRVNIEREIFPALVGGGLHAWQAGGYWDDIGTPASYLAANVAVVRGVLGGAPGDSRVADDAVVDPSATVDGGSVIGAGARVGPRATVRGSVVHENAMIGAGASLDGAVAGRGSAIAAGARLVPGTIVGAQERYGA